MMLARVGAQSLETRREPFELKLILGRRRKQALDGRIVDRLEARRLPAGVAAFAGYSRGDALAIVVAADEMGGQAELEFERGSEIERLAAIHLGEGNLEGGRRFLADLRRGLAREVLVLALLRIEPGENRLDRWGREHTVDQRRVPHQLAFARVPVETVEKPVDRMVVAQRILDHIEMRSGDGVAHETLTVSLGRSDDAPGQSEVESGAAKQTGKEIGAANIGEKADADLRHAEAVALPRHAMRAVKADADAAAETEAIDERHIRPDELLQHPNVTIGRAIEFADRAQRPLLAPFMQQFEVAAAREHGRVRGLHHHAIDVRRRRPAAIMLAQGLEHFPAQSVESGGTVERHHAGAIDLLETDAKRL